MVSEPEGIWIVEIVPTRYCVLVLICWKEEKSSLESPLSHSFVASSTSLPDDV